MAVPLRPLKVTDNASILDAVRADASLEYQRRIPNATDAGVTDTVANLYSYRQHWNEFVDSLVNRIGSSIARNISWQNPLAEFKRGMLEFGDTIEEIQVGLLTAHGYEPDREAMERDLFGTEIPDVQTNFHTVNRQDFYKVTVNQNLLKRAFLQDNGLHNFLNQLLTAPTTSDQWDEFLLTCSLFRQYESQGGFRHVHLPSVTDGLSDASDAKVAMRKMRAMADNLTFMSTKYNAARMPTFAKREDLVIFTTPEFAAAIDVEALAGAFNVDRLNMKGRVIPIPQEQFGITGMQAIMTTKDFFVIADSLMENTSQANAVTLGHNYFLHHHQIISASRFVPAVMFWEGADDGAITVSAPVASVDAITIETVDGTAVTNVSRDGLIALVSKTNTNPTGGQDSVRWSVSGNTSNKTYITQFGVLHVGGDETASNLTVKAQSTYVDPDNPRLDPLSQTLSVPVVGSATTGWPLSGKLAGINIAGTDVPGVVSTTTTYPLALAAGTKVKAADVSVATFGPADADITVATVAGGYTVTIKIDPGVGAATTYTVNVTA